MSRLPALIIASLVLTVLLNQSNIKGIGCFLSRETPGYWPEITMAPAFLPNSHNRQLEIAIGILLVLPGVQEFFDSVDVPFNINNCLPPLIAMVSCAHP